MNRINKKKQRAAQRRQIFRKMIELAVLTVFACVGAVAIWAAVWIFWIIFGS